METILQISNLQIDFRTDDGRFNLIKGLSYEIGEGEIVGIVGESGCGKTISSLATMGLLPGNAIVADGEILFEGQNLLKLRERQMQKLRGRKISMIFQEPMKALDPVFTVGDQIMETIRTHFKIPKEKAHQQMLDILKLVDIPNPERIVKNYPHELSGGMKQRIMIAMALVCEPRLLIADEPTTALDVTIQAQILDLIKNLKHRIKSSVIFITHDLGVVADICDRIFVMYAGQLVEAADKNTLFLEPKHPYTRGLLDSIPKLSETRDELAYIEGTVPIPKQFPEGCRFQPRCRFAMERCAEEPGLFSSDKSLVKCWLFEDKEAGPDTAADSEQKEEV